MPTLVVRKQSSSTYVVIRRDTDQTPGFTTLASFIASDAAAEALMGDKALRVAVLRVFEGPYESGQRPVATPTVGHPDVDSVLPAVIDAALKAYTPH